MTKRTRSSREFNQDTGGAKRAANSGPVFITDRGRPSHVLLAWDDYQRLASRHPGMVELLGHPVGIENIAVEIPTSRDPAKPAELG